MPSDKKDAERFRWIMEFIKRPNASIYTSEINGGAVVLWRDYAYGYPTLRQAIDEAIKSEKAKKSHAE